MKIKNSVMGFVYRVLWILNALCVVLSDTINIFRNLQKTHNFPGLFGSRAGLRRPFKFSNCVLVCWPRSICIQRYSITKWKRESAMDHATDSLITNVSLYCTANVTSLTVGPKKKILYWRNPTYPKNTPYPRSFFFFLTKIAQFS